MTHELLKQVHLLDPSQPGGAQRIEDQEPVDVLIADGRIVALDRAVTEIPAETQQRDCSGLVLGPGLVDLYSHSGTPGFEARETLESLGHAAAAGGFTRLTLLPDTHPCIDTPEALTAIQCPGTPVQMQVWGAITQRLEGKQLVDLLEMKEAGVAGFSDGLPLTNLILMRRLLEYLAPYQIPVALWPLQPTLAGPGVIREGVQALRLGLPDAPVMAETTALAAIIELVSAVRTPVHVMRVSTARSVDLIKAAKQSGLPVTASTTWMHLLWNSDDLKTYNTSLRLEPPIGNPADQAALIEGLEAGVIDAIAIEHQSYTYEEKTVAFGQAPPGSIGLELALPILWQTFVESGRWSAIDLWNKLSNNPAQCLQQSPPAIKVGEPAEMTLFDPQVQWQAEAQSLKTLGQNTPWINQEITGKVIKTWCPGASQT